MGSKRIPPDPHLVEIQSSKQDSPDYPAPHPLVWMKQSTKKNIKQSVKQKCKANYKSKSVKQSIKLRLEKGFIARRQREAQRGCSGAWGKGPQ